MPLPKSANGTTKRNSQRLIQKAAATQQVAAAFLFHFQSGIPFMGICAVYLTFPEISGSSKIHR